MSVLRDNRGGITTTPGTSPFVIETALDLFSPIHGSEGSAVEFAYKAQYLDPANGSDYETGVGTWTPGANTLSRTTIKTSSAGPATRVSWSGQPVAVYIVGDAESLASMDNAVETTDKKVLTAAERAEIAKVDRKLQAFPYKPDNQDLFVLIIGDSNALGIGGADPALQTSNINIQVYATPGTGTWNPADLAWRNVDPNGALVEDFATVGADPYIGMLRASNGSAGWAAANQGQQDRGGVVRLFSACTGGVDSEYWTPGGGAGKEGMSSLIANLTAAFAAIPGGPTFADVVIISSGGIDAQNDVDPNTFVANTKAMYDEMVTRGWIDEQHTQIYHEEAPQQFAAYANGWMGYQYLDEAMPQNYRILSSKGLDTAVDNTHYTPAAQNTFGLNAMKAAISGPTPKKFGRQGNFVERLAPVLEGDLISEKGSDVALFNNTAAADTTPEGTTYGAQNAHADATSGNRDGGAATLKGGDAAANEDGDGGDVILQPGAGAGSGTSGKTLVNEWIYGGLLAFLNATAEASYSTTAYIKVTCWSAIFLDSAKHVTIDTANNQITAITAGVYEVTADFSIQGNAAGGADEEFRFAIVQSSSPTFSVRGISATTNATVNKPTAVSLKAVVSLAAGESVYLSQNAPGGGTNLVIPFGQFAMKRISN